MLVTVIYYNERHKAQLAKGKGARGQVQRKPAQGPKSSLPVESPRTCFILPAGSCDGVCAVSSSSGLQAQRPGFSQGAGPVGTLC